jgi:BRCA1-associated protein
MYLAFLKKIDYFLKGDEKLNEYIFDVEKSELPTCPLCLEKMDVTSSGIHTILNMVKVVNKERWSNYRQACQVCTSLLKKEAVKQCGEETCGKNSNIWCCLVCGFLGCDRYQNCHAVKHFENTLHSYSIDLETERIWDYLGDNYVHRFLNITKSEETTNSINFEFNQSEESNPIDSKEFLMRIENIISEYNYVLSTQLEEQRKYYEKEIDKIHETNENKIKSKLQQIEKLKKEISDNKKAIEGNKKFVKEAKKKMTNINKKIKNQEDQNELTDQLAKNIDQDISKLQIQFVIL